MSNFVDKFTKDKYIGNIIMQDLFMKILNPNRMRSISKQYNVEEVELVESY